MASLLHQGRFSHARLLHWSQTSVRRIAISDRAERAQEPPTYQSYLLRLWQVRDGEERWRASIESAQTGDRESFATLDALFDFLRSRTLSGQSPVAHHEGRAGGGT
jgi:hypothetical protein